MAIGDTVNGFFTITAGTSNTIRPISGQEFVIHNVYWNNTSGSSPNLEFSMTDGTNNCIFDTDLTRGSMRGHCYHLNNTYYMKINNISAGTTMIIAYDGIQTK